MQQVSVIAIRHAHDPEMFLHGRRDDNNLWSPPSGHIEDGEDPKSAAIRELEEETGIRLKPEDLTFAGERHYKEGELDVNVHLYIVKEPWDRRVPNLNQGDGEFTKLKFLNPSIHGKLHNPEHRNALVDYLKGSFDKDAPGDLTDIKRFYLRRKKDVNGVSGTGIVATGVEFPDGRCVIRWNSDMSSTNQYDSIADVEKVHGHGGATQIVYMDGLEKAGMIYVAGDGDNIGASVERAAMANDIRRIKEMDRIIQRGQALVIRWAKERGGRPYIAGGDDVAFMISRKHVVDLEKLRAKYEKETGFTLTLGVGHSIAQAAQAMVYGKLQGKNRIQHWNKDAEAAVGGHKETPEEKYRKEGLVKSEREERPETVMVAIQHPVLKNLYLHGKLFEDQRWDIPTSEVYPGETKEEAAVRICRDQCGFEPRDLTCFRDESPYLFIGVAHDGESSMPTPEDGKYLEIRFIDPLGENQWHIPPDLNPLLAHVKHMDRPISKSELVKGAPQRMWPYQAGQGVTPKQKQVMSKWVQPATHDQDEASDADRQKIKPMTGNMRARALHKLRGATSSRVNPKGEREYLLHRTMHNDEYNQYSDNHDTINHDKISSWTPLKDVAHAMGASREESSSERGEPEGHSVVSAWVPESKIHHVPKMVGELLGDKKGPMQFRDEFEVLVGPHSSKIEGTEEPVYPDKDDPYQQPVTGNRRIAAGLPISEVVANSPYKYEPFKKSELSVRLVDAHAMARAMRSARHSNHHITKAVDDYVPTGEGQHFLTSDGLSGYTIRPGGLLTNLFSGVKGRGGALTRDAIAKGAVHLDTEEGYLSDLYSKHGFSIDKRDGKSVHMTLTKGAAGDWQAEGYTFKVQPPKERHENVLRDGKRQKILAGHDLHVTAHAPNGEQVGKYHFWADAGDNVLGVGNAHTHPSHQRKGLATEAYRLAEKSTGRTIVPDNQSDSAVALWSQGDRPFGNLKKSDHFRDHGDLSHYLKTGTYALLTPHRSDASDLDNRAAHGAFTQELNKLGLKFTPVTGNWGGATEPSYMVHDISRKHATDLGKKYNQLAVIHATKGQHEEIPTHPSYKGMGAGNSHEAGTHLPDNYSELKTAQGPVRFRLNFGGLKKSDQDLHLIHFSPKQGLKQLDPAKMGTGVPSSEYKRGLPEIARTYFYRKGTPYESLVTGPAKSAYHVTLPAGHKLYDLANDHENLVQHAVRDNQGAWNSDMVYKKIKEAGYHGLFNSSSSLPNVVALFHPVQPHKEEPVSMHKAELRKAPEEAFSSPEQEDMWQSDNMPRSTFSPGYSKVITKPAGALHGKPLYHHVISNDSEIQHMLSHSKNPAKDGLVHMTGEKYKGALQVLASAANPHYQGMGLGTKLYELAAKHHGALSSDSALSEGSDAIYRKLATKPGYKAKLQPWGKPEGHYLRYMKTKLKRSELRKAPVEIPDHIAPTLEHGRTNKMLREGYKHVATLPPEPGMHHKLYHHVFQNAKGNAYHTLSDSKNPMGPGIAQAQVVTDGPHPRVVASVVDREHRGKGIGKLLYHGMLRHHGTLSSDVTQTPKANSLWHNLHKIPGVTTELAQYGSAGQHVARYRKP